MKKIIYILSVFVWCTVVVACGRAKSLNNPNTSTPSTKEGDVDTSKLKDVSESTAVPDDILSAVSEGAQQQVLTGFDDSVGGVALRKIDGNKVYVVVTASLGSLPEDDKYDVILRSDKLSTAIGSLTKIGENQYQLKYAGTSEISPLNMIEVVQASNKKSIFTGKF